jgi:citrate synthase
MDSPVNPALLGARAATELLGIKRETLYAYVSRGLVRSVAGEGRERMYVRSDVEALKARHDARAGHAAVAGGALRFGEPVLDSAITRIDPVLGPVYRGIAAVDLADQGVPFEKVAALLWSGSAPFVSGGLGLPARSLAALVRNPAPLDLLAALVPLLATRDSSRFQATDEAERVRGARLIARMASCLAMVRGRKPAEGASIAETVARALGHRSGAPAIDLALILCADHELNPSTFAARIAASAGADLYACVSAALATLSGPRHGGACDRVEAMIHEIGLTPVTRAIDERARRGESIPGFGHRLYPQGDPRAAPLLDAAHAIAPRDPVVRTILNLTRAMRDAGREPATVDLGLVAIASALKLPRGGAVSLFAIGRTVGWIAHTLEQRNSDYVLRPRARYVGAP